jgi:sialidase-1
MGIRIAIFAIVLLFTSCKVVQKSGSPNIEKELVLRLAPVTDNPRNSEGGFVTLKNGRILFIYSKYTGKSSHDHASAYLASRYSDDEGKTWSKEDMKVVEKEGKMNVMSVSLLRLQNGNIALFYLRKNSEGDCIPLMRISKDETKTWGAPVECITDIKGYYVLNNDRVIQLKNGRLLMPVARHTTFNQPRFKESADLFTYYSDDNGASWKRSAQVPNQNNIITQEPGVVALSDSRIEMYIRTDDGYQFVSYSGDKGQTWSAIEPWTLKSPLSPATVEVIPGTKKLLAVWNDKYAYRQSYRATRSPLTIGTSADDGKTWYNVSNIETADTRFCYTAIHFTKKHVLLAYCSGGLEQTDIVRIPLKQIK